MTAIIILIFIGAWITYLAYAIQRQICKNCPFKHECEELMINEKANLCEQNYLNHPWNNESTIL